MSELRNGDVFRFQWNDEQRGSYSNHCFDGQLVAVERKSEILLGDTYWGFPPRLTDGTVFTLEQAAKNGTLELKCNLDEVEPIKDGIEYYDETDVFNLSYQHGCYKQFFKRKGAQRSRDRMLKCLYEKQEKLRSEVRNAISSLEFNAARIEAIKLSSDLSKEWV